MASIVEIKDVTLDHISPGVQVIAEEEDGVEKVLTVSSIKPDDDGLNFKILFLSADGSELHTIRVIEGTRISNLSYCFRQVIIPD